MKGARGEGQRCCTGKRRGAVRPRSDRRVRHVRHRFGTSHATVPFCGGLTTGNARALRVVN